MTPVATLIAVFRGAPTPARAPWLSMGFDRDVFLCHVEARRCLDAARLLVEHALGEIAELAIIGGRDVYGVDHTAAGVRLVYEDTAEPRGGRVEWRWKHYKVERGTIRQRKARERQKLAERRIAR